FSHITERALEWWSRPEGPALPLGPPLLRKAAHQDRGALRLLEDRRDVHGLGCGVGARARGTHSGKAADVGGDEADVAGAALRGIELAHFGQSHVAVDSV